MKLQLSEVNFKTLSDIECNGTLLDDLFVRFSIIALIKPNRSIKFDWVRLPNVTVRVVTGIVVLGSKNSVEFSKKVSPCFHSRLLAAYFAETMPF